MNNSTPRNEDMKRIYIVDDARWHNVLLKNLLCQQGYEVKTFTDGHMLLENMKTYPPHLIISDINMPQIDGFELCKMIKELPEGANIPVVFVSSLEEETVRDRAERHGAVGYLQKPFEKEPLLNVVAQKL